MKKILTILMLFASTIMFSQTSDSTGSSISGYVSYSLSMTNSSTFRASSYTGVETGVMYDNISLGAIFGRGNLVGLGRKTDNIGQYFYEVKASASAPIGSLTGSVIFGYGGYFNSSHNFIEYGLGVSYTCNRFGYGLTVSEWDGTMYMTPCITFNF